ncbi:MAG TPA: ThuA domain-containing protein [Candidatus Limnocylindria bacterium]|nr:ThuA domain-containing protein [Candidatus Limnocylindria bacterium]
MASEPPVRDGLVLRFDASSQAASRQNASLPSVRHLQPMDLLLDASTNARMATQTSAERRPVFISDGQAAYLKFDGKDDFLTITGPRRSTKAMTLFLLVAPKSNEGYFSALFGCAPLGKSDYVSGLNFDFGPNKTADLSVLNVESAGATGFRDMLMPGFFNAAARPFTDFHVFTVSSKVGKAGTQVFVDGFKGGERDRTESEIGLDQIIIGGRFYSNDPNQPPYAQGFFDGAMAEVLVYDRALSDDERRAVEQALLTKTVALNALLRGAKGHALETVKDPPLVQMFMPGFTVQELPLKIGNLNNVRYRHDGKLVGLGYDGRIHLLTDTDDDGLEDKDDFFWTNQTLRSPIGMALTAKDDPRGDGIFVASKGKVSFILDKDRDGRADEEKVIATGWPELPHGVDTLGLAVDPKDGSIYFGLGCVNFVDAYLIDKATGRSHYDLENIHGTIQRVSADFSTRETICTGVRFTCALAFNRAGDLFATDQEGATWMPNGNPLDELLHIERGKHYGFPPRHPKHLPNVIDEPPVIEYGPQHQSTVGMVFNEGVNGGAHFGPAHWESDAFVCGESRGKLWRTKLAKTPLGYVAQNQLIASLSMLLVDACVTPEGDLIVACHSGPPDWGTGPAGEGRIFKIRYTGRTLPQPVLAWAAASDEFRIAFDRPLDPADWVKGKESVKIEAGEHVSAGDRFEVIRPGYQIVRDQMTTPRRSVEMLGLTLSEDRRTLGLRVPRQTEMANYAITLPLPEKWKQTKGITQHPQMDLLVTLNGVVATVAAPDGKELRSVLPHASLAASGLLTTGSAEHEGFLKAAGTTNATLTVRGNVDVSNPFVPAVQPGAKLDWDMATDPFASATFTVRSDYSRESDVSLETSPATRLRSMKPLVVKNPGGTANGLFLAKDTLRHPLSTARAHVPWAVEKSNIEQRDLAKTRTDVKGNWLRGRRLFFGEAGCVTCHTIRGEGMAFGPDLSNLIFRDRDSVLQDILQPSATINPDQAGTLVTLKAGTFLSGIVRSLTDDKLVLSLPAGAQSEIPRANVATMEPLKTSLMPAGVVDQLSVEQREDLITFLLVNPLEPAAITRTDPPVPPARRMAEIVEVLGSNPTPPQQTPPLRILLCSGPKDHGLDEHDYPLWLDRWSRLLALGDNVSVKTSMGFPTHEQLADSAVAVFFNANPGWNAEKAAAFDTFHKQGGGAVYLHYGVDGGKDPAAVAERMGLAFTLGSKFRHGEFDLVFQQRDHPITLGFPTLHFTDETYWNMRGDVSRLNILGTGIEDNAPRPQLWTLERHQSRIVGCIPGHYTWTFDDPLFRILVFRSLCWAAKQENVDRLAELALVGARIAP